MASGGAAGPRRQAAHGVVPGGAAPLLREGAEFAPGGLAVADHLELRAGLFVDGAEEAGEDVAHGHVARAEVPQ